MTEVLISRCRDPRWNLALEETLIDRGAHLLYLWQNEPSVILGRNQDPYSECEPEKLAEKGIHLVRRKSGGGAVYHDLGNLNITFLSEKSPEAPEKNFAFLTAVLKSLGAEARVSGRNDLEVGGKKISGSAFYETETAFCHHCTMLVSTDSAAMAEALKPSRLKLQSKGIASVRSRVANLEEICPGLTAETLSAAIVRRAGGTPRYITRQDMEAVPEIAGKAERYGSWEWNFGESPSANLVRERKFPWGLVKAELRIRSSVIEACRITTDSLDAEPFSRLSAALTGRKPEREDLLDALSVLPDRQVRQDLLSLLTEG